MAIQYKNLYQPDQKFNNKINWEEFRTLPDWEEVISQFKKRIENFFFDPIKKLYKYSFFRKLKYFHNFPISNICWSLIDIFTQLNLGRDVLGYEIDQFLLREYQFFTNIRAAKNLANSYLIPNSKYTFTVYDIFRNKPFHNAMVKGLGSLDIRSSDVFTIEKSRINIDARIFRSDFIVENPIELYKSIKNYFTQYISNLKIDPVLQRNFKKRIEELFEFQFQNI